MWSEANFDIVHLRFVSIADEYCLYLELESEHSLNRRDPRGIILLVGVTRVRTLRMMAAASQPQETMLLRTRASHKSISKLFPKRLRVARKSSVSLPSRSRMLPTRLRFVKRWMPWLRLTRPLLKSGRPNARDRLRSWPLPKAIEVLQQDQSARHDLFEEAAAVITELEEAKSGIEFADNTISNLEISLVKLTAERDEREAVIAGIEAATSEQLNSLSIERDAALRYTKELETQLVSATEERDASRSELEASNTKVVELAAAFDSPEESTRETSLQMNSVSEEKEAALAAVTELQSMLTDSCQGYALALSMLEVSNTKIDVLVTEQGELQSHNKSLEVQLEDSTQAHESARSEFEAGTSTIAELKDDTNASVMSGTTSDEEFRMADDDADDDDLGNDDTDGGDDDEDDDDAGAPLDGRESSLRRTGTPVPPPTVTAVADDSGDDDDDDDDVADAGQSWEDRLTELADYHKIHKHSNVPICYGENMKLGRWVGTQRTQYKLHEAGKKSQMTTFRIQGLESLGFEWDSYGATWEVRLSELVGYRKEHGHCNVTKGNGKNAKLARWVTNQRQRYRFMTLPRIQALESLGFEWDRHGAAWEDRLSELADYRKIHGHCNVPHCYSENTKLGYWVAGQKINYKLHRAGKKSPMTTSRIQALKSLGFE
jgi:hypothetical protein